MTRFVGLAALIAFLVALAIWMPARAEAREPCGDYRYVCEAALRSVGLGGDPELLAYFGDTMFCESRNRAWALGDGGHAFGLWQIHVRRHNTISLRQALDPIAATFWAARQWAYGYARWWTCYRMLEARFGPPVAFQ